MTQEQKRFFAIVVITSIFVSSVIGFIAAGAAVNALLKKQAGNTAATEGNVNNFSFSGTPQEEKIVAVAKEASPAVVSVIISKDLSALQRSPENFWSDLFGNDPFFGDFFGNTFQNPNNDSAPNKGGSNLQEIGGGTGFIVSADGLIITNKHVVADANADYAVLTNDGQRYPARVLARDPAQDIAIIKVDKTGLPTLKLGDSDKIEIGQTAVAIGNALGEFRNTVSVGVISGLRRSVAASGSFGTAPEQLEGVIQTDAAVNPGNSGGPLMNLSGEVIGINVAVAQGAQNIGFALPINLAKRDIAQVQQSGKISYPFLGVRYVAVNPNIQRANNLAVDFGAWILAGQNASEPAVVPGSPADKAGILENDIILEADGQKITQVNTLAQILQKHNVGDSMNLKVLSKGQEKTVRVVLGER